MKTACTCFVVLFMVLISCGSGEDPVWQALPEAPVFSPDGGIFSSETNVYLSSVTTGCHFFYTIDGSTPTLNHGILYNSDTGIVLPAGTSGMVIRAIATDVGTNIQSRVAVSQTFYAGGWAQVGEDGYSPNGVPVISSAIYNGQPILAYASPFGVSVMYYNDKLRYWDYLGNSGFSDEVSDAVSLFVFKGDTKDVPYAAYNDNSTNMRLTVKRYNGVEWELVGNAAISREGYGAKQIALYVYKDGAGNPIPYVAYYDNCYSNSSFSFHKTSVLCYSNGSWTNLGGDLNGYNYRNSLVVYNSNGSPVVCHAYFPFAVSTKRCYYRTYSGGSWSSLPNIKGSHMDLVMGYSNSEPLLVTGVWSNYSHIVFQYDGSAWQRMGEPFNGGGGAVKDEQLQLCLGISNVPYAAFREYNSFAPVVMKYGGSGWQLVGNKNFTGRAVNGINLTVITNNSKDDLYTTYIDSIGEKVSTVVFKRTND